MSLADQVRELETQLANSALTRDEFQARLSELIRSFSASGDTTRPASSAAAAQLASLGGPTPTHIGAYELVELLGQGGMGAVYLAKHLLKPGLFAVKVPRAALLSQPGFGRRFRREASVGLKLDHPGIVRVNDLVIDGPWAAIVMEFVAGPNLETLLRNHGGPLPRNRVVDLMSQVLDAMHYAHEQGVIHRDLKPKNLMVKPSGQLQVTDFGVAGLVGMEETQAGTLLGTAPYMAPELYTGLRTIDRRADIYALGMTLFKLLTGHLPFPAEMNSYQVLRAKEDGMVPMPSGLPDGIVDVIIQAIHPDPERRFSDCRSFREALTLAAEEEWELPPGQTFQLVDPPRSLPQREPTSPLQYAFLSLGVALTLSVGWLAYEMSRAPASPEEPSAAPTEAADTRPVPPAGADAPAEVALQLPEGADGEQDELPSSTSEEPTDDGSSSADSPATRAPSPSPRRSAAASTSTRPRRSAAAAARTPRTEPPEELEESALRSGVDGAVVTIPAPELPEPPPPERGELFLSSRPASQIEIDGRSYGSSERTAQGIVLEPGTYSVRFLCETGECADFSIQRARKTLEVQAGKQLRFTADFFAINERP